MMLGTYSVLRGSFLLSSMTVLFIAISVQNSHLAFILRSNHHCRCQTQVVARHRTVPSVQNHIAGIHRIARGSCIEYAVSASDTLYPLIHS